MHNGKAGIWLAVCLAVVPAAAGELHSAQGFSLRCPDGWVVVTDQNRDGLPKTVRDLLGKSGGIDPSRIAAFLVDPADDGFLENINVEVTAGAKPVDEKTGEKFRHTLLQQLKRMGMEPRDLRVEEIEVAGHDAFSARYDVSFPFHDRRIRQWRVQIPVETRTYVVTCSSEAADFDRFEPVFGEVIDSVQLHGGKLDSWFHLPAALRAAVIGGTVALMVAGIALLVRRKRRATGGQTFAGSAM